MHRAVPAIVLTALAVSCGSGTRVEVINDLEVEIDSLTIEFSGVSESWTGIGPGDSESARLEIPAGSMAVIRYTFGQVDQIDEVMMPDSAFMARRISIFISDGATSLRYSF
jgi:hypothetical protein